MSSVVRDAALALQAALSGAGYQGYHDPAKTVDPPAALVGPPELEWESHGTLEPTLARFPVIVMVASDEYAVERLWEIPGAVALAVNELADAVVLAATPALYTAGGAELPSYELIVEIGL